MVGGSQAASRTWRRSSDHAERVLREHVPIGFTPVRGGEPLSMEQVVSMIDAAEQEAERQRAQQTPNMSYAEGIRGQCRIVEAFVDDVLGKGSAAALGLDGNDLGKALSWSAKQLYVGVEYDYWKNKYGIEDSGAFKTNQNTTSLLFKYHF